MQAQATILVVDDDEDICAAVSAILSLEGYHVVAARDGQDALQMITEGKCTPQLVISDIVMPHMDGYAFFEAVRQIPFMRAAPFIFLTAYGSRKQIHLGRELGVDDYLVKPFEPPELIASVRSRLGRAQAIRQQVESELDNARWMLVQLLSHELRTPLTCIAGGFDLLVDAVAHSRDNQLDMAASVDLIRSGTQRLLRLAEQVVTYTELISGVAKRHIEQFGERLSILELIENAVAVAHPELTAYNINLETSYTSAEPVEVYGSSRLLVNAFYEVIRNAIMFSDRFSTVHVQISREGQFAVVKVIDRGRGIAETDLESVWQIMVQSDRRHQEQQGAGMGLPIVRQTMLLHGGDASLESRLGEGTTVMLRLPICS